MNIAHILCLDQTIYITLLGSLSDKRGMGGSLINQPQQSTWYLYPYPPPPPPQDITKWVGHLGHTQHVVCITLIYTISSVNKKTTQIKKVIHSVFYVTYI